MGPTRTEHRSPSCAPRILAVSSYHDLGGGEHLLIDLLGALAAPERGFAVELVVLGDGPVVARAEAHGVPVTVGPPVRFSRPATIAAGVRAVRDAVRRTGPDIVHAANPKAQIVGQLAARGLAVAHTVQVLDAPPPRDPYALATSRLAGLRFAITPTAAAAWRGALHGQPLELIEPGVDGPGLRARAALGDPDRVWSAAGLAPGPQPRVVMVSRLQRYKGTFDFVELARRVTVERDAQFLLVGPDERMEPGVRADLRARIGALGLADRIAVAGPLEETDLAAVVQDATLAVHPAYRETFGLVVVEALALGTPVLAYAAPGPDHILRHGGGAVVPVHDLDALTTATVQALDEADLRARWIAEAPAVATRFGLDRMADDYARAFRSVVASRRSA